MQRHSSVTLVNAGAAQLFTSLFPNSCTDIGIHLIHSVRLFLKRIFKSTTTQRRSKHSTDTVSEFHAKAQQATASEGLVQGPYVAARTGFEPATLRTKGAESTNEAFTYHHSL